MTRATANIDSVLIVGGGPTGLVMAAELARRKIPCRIIDISRSATDKSKAIGIQARTLELFELSGIVELFTARGKKAFAANVYHDNRKLVHLTFNELESSYQYILMLPQSETETILIDHLESLGGTVERGTKLTSFTQDADGVKAELLHADGSTEEVRTPWLIGCDGAHSTIRHQLDLLFLGEEYEEGFQLADVKILWVLRDDEIHIFVHDGWLIAAFPLPDGHHRLIADVPPELAPLDKTPSLEDWQKIVDDRLPIKAALSESNWTANYRIHRRLVSKLRDGRVFLVGDAAHIHSPAGAQGMNTGIQDAYNLAWKLAMFIDGVAQESVLDSYHAERYPVEKSVLTVTDLPMHFLGLTNPIAQAARDRLMPFLTNLGIVQQKARGFISELSVNYIGSHVVLDGTLNGGPRAGERAPNGTLISVDGTSVSLYQLLVGTDHTLLIFEPERDGDFVDDECEALSIFLSDRLAGKVKIIRVAPTATGSHYGDQDLVLADRYGGRRGAAYLIRPDGYIGFRSTFDNAASRLQSYIDSFTVK